MLSHLICYHYVYLTSQFCNAKRENRSIVNNDGLLMADATFKNINVCLKFKKGERESETSLDVMTVGVLRVTRPLLVD